MKIGVVVAGTFAPWDERGVIFSRFVGALACFASVEVLIGDGPERVSEPEGALTRELFPARPQMPGRLDALELLSFGPRVPTRASCQCTTFADQLVTADLTAEMEDELLTGIGGDSPELVDHVEASDYDLLVFARADTAATVGGLRRVAGRTPTLLLPLLLPGPRMWLRSVREAYAAADCVVVATSFESTLASQVGAQDVATTGSVLRVHDLALRNEPILFDDRAVVVAGDWAADAVPPALLSVVRRINRDLDGAAVVRLIGPGWEALPGDVRVAHADSRSDVWRWMARCLAVWDPHPARLLGREVLEAMQYGTPVVTQATGAGREHAERGNGGLWYRSYDELLECIRAFAGDDNIRKTLGAQGQAYAVGTFGDTDSYIDRVAEIADRAVGSFRRSS